MEMTPRRALLDDKWELYDTRQDFSLVNDLAAQNPAKLKELQDLFMKEAVKYHVLPIDDRIVERVNAKLAGRPDLMGDRSSLTLHAGMKGMSENVFINIKNRSLTITADVDSPQGGASGVILAQGGRFGGWSLYMKAGKPIYVYNFLGLQRFTVASPQAVPAGKSTIRSSSPTTAAAGQGWTRDDLRERQEGRRGSDRAHAADHLLRRRDRRRGRGRRDAGDGGLHGLRQQVHRQILKVTVDVKAMGRASRPRRTRLAPKPRRSWKPQGNLDEMSGKRQRQQGRSGVHPVPSQTVRSVGAWVRCSRGLARGPRCSHFDIGVCDRGLRAR